MPKARSAGRCNAKWPLRPQRRGARPKLENEDFARARPAEGGKPGLSGLVGDVAGVGFGQADAFLRVAALGAREGGFVARSRKMGRFATRFAS